MVLSVGRSVGWSVGRSSKYFENSRNKCCEGFYATGGGFGRAFCLYDKKVNVYCALKGVTKGRNPKRPIPASTPAPFNLPFSQSTPKGFLTVN